MALTEKQKTALQAVKTNRAVSIKGSVQLKAAGLITTSGVNRPGWLNAALTSAGDAELSAA